MFRSEQCQGFRTDPEPKACLGGRLEIFWDRREALLCCHCRAIEPSAKASQDSFSCTDHLQNAWISLKLFAFIIFIFPSFFSNWKENELFYLSPTFRVSGLIVCPYHFKPESFIDLQSTSILQLQTPNLAGGVRGGKNFLFPFKLLLVQTEIPFKPEGLDWSLRIKESRTDRKSGFSLELYLKRVTSDSGLLFSLLHPLQNAQIFPISPAKSLNCINMSMCLQPFFCLLCSVW